MKTKNIAFILLSTVMFMSFFPSNLTTEAQSIGVSAQSAVLMEQESGRLFYAKDANTPRKIASITKIMTAILAIESGRMQETVTITPSMVQTEGSSIYLQVGEKIRLEDLVYGLMLRSGNDAAQAIAEYVGGSIPGFVHLMNEKANWLGMDHTNFTNPSGLDDGDKHVSTAYDMALVTRYAMKNAEFRKISGTKVYSTPDANGKWNRVWKNKNKLLTGLYKYSTGGKTGFTKKARRTLVSTASKNGMNLIAVTLVASSDWNDHIHMFETAFKHYSMKQIVAKGAIDGLKYKAYQNHVVLSSDIVYPLSSNEVGQVRVEYNILKPKKGKPIPKDVGRVNVYLANQLIRSVPLTYQKKVYKPAFLEIWKQVLTSELGGKRYG